MRRLFYALPVALTAMPAAAELPPEVWFSPCKGPVATCVRPVATHTQKETCSGCSSQPASAAEPQTLRPIADPTHDILARWEEASRAFYPVTRAERLRLATERPELTGQQIELVCALKQPVRADELVRRYQWTTLRTHGRSVTLIATPHDRLERLFYDQFVVDVDASTGRPSGLRFGTVLVSGKVGRPTVTLRPWLDPSRLEVQLVGFESHDDEPRPLRTADASDNTPQRLPVDSEMRELPPAPELFECDQPYSP